MKIKQLTYHCNKEKVVLTNFGHPSYTQNCCKSLRKVYKQPLTQENTIH